MTEAGGSGSEMRMDATGFDSRLSEMATAPASLYYFAFGMNLEPGTMPDAVKVGPARLYGWRLAFRVFATLERCGCEEAWGGCEDCDVENQVYAPGGLWRITPELLYRLDAREGYPHLYDRIEVTVQLPWEAQRAIVYVPSARYTASPLELPPAGYLSMVQSGYDFFGLDERDRAKLAEALYTAYKKRRQ